MPSFVLCATWKMFYMEGTKTNLNLKYTKNSKSTPIVTPKVRVM